MKYIILLSADTHQFDKGRKKEESFCRRLSFRKRKRERERKKKPKASKNVNE